MGKLFKEKYGKPVQTGCSLVEILTSPKRALVFHINPELDIRDPFGVNGGSIDKENRRLVIKRAFGLGKEHLQGYHILAHKKILIDYGSGGTLHDTDKVDPEDYFWYKGNSKEPLQEFLDAGYEVIHWSDYTILINGAIT